MTSKRLAVFVLVMMLVPAYAAAHLNMTDPPHRYDHFTQKEPPCGKAGGERGDTVTVFEPGETITVVWNEFIDHPAHYRISFDADGDDDFVDPPCLADCDTEQPTIEEYSNDAVLLDGIADKAGGIYEVEVELPDVTCDNCTLQVMQVMYEKNPYTLPGDDLYYNCADLILRPADADDTGTTSDTGTSADAGTDDTGTDDAGADADTSDDVGETVADGGAADAASDEVSVPQQGSEGGCTPTGRGAPLSPLAFAVFVLLAVGRRRP